MTRRRVAIGVAALGILVLGAIVIGTDGSMRTGGTKPFVTISELAVNGSEQKRQKTGAPKLGPSGISHATPPPLEALRDYSHAQSRYDQEAMPGDFVTPPAVSVEH